MPIFGGSKRPRLDGLTRDEEKRRDSLNPEVLKRAGEGGVAGQAPAALAVLRDKVSGDRDALWALLLGRQCMSMRRFGPAIDAFIEAVARDGTDVRGYYGAGAAYFEAAEAKLNLGPAATGEVTSQELTVDNMYHEALRYFRRGLELTADREERDTLRNATSLVEKAIAKKAGRL